MTEQNVEKETELTEGHRKGLVSESFPHRLRTGRGMSVLVKVCQNPVRTWPYRWYFLSHRTQSQRVTQAAMYWTNMIRARLLADHTWAAEYEENQSSKHTRHTQILSTRKSSKKKQIRCGSLYFNRSRKPWQKDLKCEARLLHSEVLSHPELYDETLSEEQTRETKWGRENVGKKEEVDQGEREGINTGRERKKGREEQGRQQRNGSVTSNASMCKLHIHFA